MKRVGSSHHLRHLRAVPHDRRVLVRCLFATLAAALCVGDILPPAVPGLNRIGAAEDTAGAESGMPDAERTQVQRAIAEYTAAMETQDRHRRLERFARAEQLFRQTMEGSPQQSPVHNAALYVNLGNAALQAERLGPAIAAYRRALALQPQHAQARQNLGYARSLLPDWIRNEEATGLIDSLFFWRAMIPRGQVVVVGAGCFLAAAVLFATGFARRRPLLRNAALLPLVAWAVLTASLLISPDQQDRRNLVVLTETTVFTADSANSAPRLSKSLPGGAEVSLRQQRAEWSEIQLPDGHTSGWVRSSSLETL